MNGISKRTTTERLIIAKTLIEGVLEELPSAQPEERTETHACDCISRQAVLHMAHDWAYDFCDPEEVWAAMKEIMDLPAAQPVRQKGEWEEIEVIPEAYDIAGVKTWASKMRCNQCGFTTLAIEGGFAQYNFCPNCGAKMER